MKDTVSFRYKSAELVNQANNSSFEGSIVIENTELMSIAIKSNTTNLWSVLNENVYNFYWGLTFPRNHYMYTAFNEKVKHLNSGGFIDFWLDKWFKHQKIIEKPPPAPLVVLSMKDLSIGFQIWLLALLISSVAFVVELLRYWTPKVAKLLVFKLILRLYFEHKSACH